MTSLRDLSHDKNHKQKYISKPPLNEWRFPLDKNKKQQSLTAIEREAACKRVRHYPSFTEHVWNQMRFHSLFHWLIQGGLLFAAMLLALYLRRTDSGDLKAITACSVFFTFAGNVCFSQTARLFSWHMAELEQTLYLNLKQMVCIRMLEAGTADLLILVLILGITGKVNTLGIGVSLIYMLVPFLWSNILYLHMLTSLRSSVSGFRSPVLGLLCGIPALFPVIWEPVYRPDYLNIWQVLALSGILLFIAEITNLLGKIEQGDSFWAV